MSQKIVIIDYGMCNLGSVRRAFEECGASDAIVSSDFRDLASADKIILPGVGAFTKGMQNLKAGGWIEPLREAALDKKIPLLGICLGMQLLSDKGFEGGEIEGLGLISGEVRKLESKKNSTSKIKERIPHMGWNEVHHDQKSILFDDIQSGTDFYFVHSYYFLPKDNKSTIGQTPYCGKFSSVIGSENIFGVQFHPEKSQKPGFQLIRNFLRF
ncbi:MAG: imidazole glycerol phosphate synthase subunit HisH [Deltaproteobacteria bacterium]|nr:imidazole glycerol phosphate synthase subunit HisH [Deltaproteobacteria bacterium]